MVKRVFALGTGVVGLALVAVLFMGLAGAASASAAQHRPVVASVSMRTGSATGGATVVITGKYFKLHSKNVVRAVTFGAKAAKRVRVLSATKIRCTAPAGEGTVHIRVTTTKGTSRRVAADKFTYVGPATEMALQAGDAQTASAGTAVTVKPSVLVEDAGDNPVAGVHVTFAVASGGGSVTGETATTDAAGIATVGSWKLGGTAGANSLTATAPGLTGSPVTFTATGDAGILTVKQQGTPIRSYSLTELQALTAFSGWAGLFKNPAVGPDAITGVKVTDVVADALGTSLAAGQSVDVSEVDATPYSKTMTYDQLVTLTGFTYSDATTRLTMVPTGNLAAVLIYSDPAGLVMKPGATGDGPLRFAVADSVSENMVYAPTNTSVSKVNVLNVTGPATQMALSAGDGQTASAGTAVAVKPSVLVKDAGNGPVAGVHVTFAVATGGGSATGADAVTNAAGIATVGSWKLGGTAGANTLTATVAGLTGSPVTFTATGDAGILTVQQAGTPVRSYSLTELQALTAFNGFAGLFKNPAIGPDAVTGVRVTDIVADALGTALASGQSVAVSEVDATPYSKTMTYDQLVNLTGFTYNDATTRLTMVPTGTLAAILIYSDLAGLVMKPGATGDGPLRFAVADSVSENMAYGLTNTSVSKVNVLNVTGP